VKRLILLGEAREKIASAVPCQAVSRVDSMEEAVSVAAATAQAGDVVLLSPACASFDMFRDYQHRGDVFKQSVWDLPK